MFPVSFYFAGLRIDINAIQRSSSPIQDCCEACRHSQPFCELARLSNSAEARLNLSNESEPGAFDFLRKRGICCGEFLEFRFILPQSVPGSTHIDWSSDAGQPFIGRKERGVNSMASY